MRPNTIGVLIWPAAYVLGLVLTPTTPLHSDRAAARPYQLGRSAACARRGLQIRQPLDALGTNRAAGTTEGLGSDRAYRGNSDSRNQRHRQQLATLNRFMIQSLLQIA